MSETQDNGTPPDDPIKPICPVHKDEEAAPSPEVLALMARIEELTRQNKALVQKELDSAERQTRCTCTEKDLSRKPRQLHYKAATYYFGEARQKALNENKEKDRRKGQVIQCIVGMIKKGMAMTDLTSSASPGDTFYQWKKEQAQELAEQLMSIKAINIHDIVQIFQKKEQELKKTPGREFKADKILADQEDFEELAYLLNAKRPIEPYLEKLIHYTNDTRLMRLEEIWREMYGSYTPGEKIKERASFSASAQKANLWAAKFFGGYPLHPKVEANNRLSNLSQAECDALGMEYTSEDRRGLADVLAKTLPTDEESFKISVSAMAKIHFMHLAESIRSQIDFNEMKVVSQHLKRVLEQFRTRRPDGKFVFDAFGEENKLVVEIIEVADEKSEESMVRKSMDKDPDFSKDFDHSDIQDRVRAYVMLTEESSKDPEARNRAAEKIIAFLCSIFGTDASKSRLRYAFDNGVTNGSSTGKHQAVHMTIRYRYQCRSNGENDEGMVKVRTIPVEWQIQGYMNLEERERDHQEYVAKKDGKITRMTGMEVSFKDFVEDLCDAILSKNYLKDKSKITRKEFEHPIREKMARILFKIITKHDAEGVRVNQKVLEEMMKNERQKEKLKKVIEQFETQEAGHITYLREKIRKTGKLLEPTGWRDRVQKRLDENENVKPLMSHLNELAVKAGQVLEEIEKPQSKDASVSPSEPEFF